MEQSQYDTLRDLLARALRQADAAGLQAVAIGILFAQEQLETEWQASCST